MKKCTDFLALILVIAMLLSLSACASSRAGASSAQPAGQIYLYGEAHSVKKVLDRELELWRDYYDNQNMRHLFVEYPYYTAELLNEWMQADSDDILDAIYKDWVDTAAQAPVVKEFYRQIKRLCPETVFHGTDVGHQYHTTGQRFLKLLKERNQEASAEYKRAQEVIEQGRFYYQNDDGVYRENKMAENFIYEFDQLDGESIMGIYGSGHTDFEALDYSTKSVPCMAGQLKKHYGDAISSEDLTWLIKEIQPLRSDNITLGGKEYTAAYFGKEDLSGFKDFAFREFWRLENAYDDFKSCTGLGNVLPYNNYPMLIEIGQVFVVDYTKKDGTVQRGTYRSDGDIWENMPSTTEFIIE